MAVMNDLSFDPRVTKEAVTLLSAGYDLTIVALEGGNLTPEQLIMATIIRVKQEKTKIHTLLFSKKLLHIGNQTQQAMYTELVKVHADIYHAHDLNTLLPIIRAARLNNSKVVYDSHELFTETINSTNNGLLGSGYSLLLKWYFRTIEKKFIGDTDVVITVNDAIADELQKRYSITRPSVIMNCPELHDIKKKDLKVKFGLPNNAKIIIYQGGVDKFRKLDSLIRALLLLPEEYFLVMFCIGDLSSLNKIVSILPTRKRVILTGPIEPQDLAGYTQSAHIGVIPFSGLNLNKKLALPNKLFEYMMAGIPVAASDLPVMRSVIRQSNVGDVFPDLSAHTIAKVIRMICESPRYQEMKENCITASRSLYNWQKESLKLLALYENL
ncbi:MAG: hypothetical protein A2898_02890 [Candidatus Kerfeldbacteria bacterium RIFCSPLOWO2_01_FULL_48_11]|uniref:Uncharacterized protein n=1 Tax=Candidatus Kerfeldbacteria bacterium RIFCSPLOWO2_01_FULL_48_11 TaxID=1798543 RepID=A0A1G2B8X2_9BACT|nr:MAG: hypothetical protein A2898_02890 [Candidatus Kerfeldbacteria bacterium RIFCSPLOWO2_01_FULL_48_11]